MKITQVNNDQLNVSESGKSNIFGGIMVMIVGLIAGVAPLLSDQLPWWTSLIGVGLFLLGGFMLKSASSSLIVLRRVGVSEVTVKKLIGGASTHNTFNSGSVTSVRLETYTDYSTSNNGSSTQRDTPQRERVSKLLLAMQDGSELEIGTKRVTGSSGISLSGFSTGSMVAAPLHKEASQIAEFLGVPLDASQSGEMGIIEMAQAAKTIFTDQTPVESTNKVAQTPIIPLPVDLSVPLNPVVPVITSIAPVNTVTPAAPVNPNVPPPVIPSQPYFTPKKPPEQ